MNSAGTRITGGSTSLALTNNGATFANAAGAPVVVTGVANGQTTFDAVNYGQLKSVEKIASRGVASATALANIGQVGEGKAFSVGAGVGNYNGETSIAIGASARVGSGVVKASVGTSTGSGSKAAFGVGGAWSF